MTINERHKQLLADYKAVIKIGAAYDETGGWLPDEQLPMLMEKPTKKMACTILLSYLEYWFNSGIEANDRGGHNDKQMNISEFIDEEPHLFEIAERYNLTIY